MKALMNRHMAKETPVRDHVLKMMSLLGDMTTLGVEGEAISMSILFCSRYLIHVTTFD